MQSTALVSCLLVVSLALAAAQQPLEDDFLGQDFSEPWLSEPPMRHHRHHHHSHHHHGHRHPGFRLRHHRAALAMTAPAETSKRNHLGAPRHPAIERELNSMDNEIQELNARRHAAGDAREHLEGMVSDTSMHMNDALSIKHEMVREEARIGAKQEKVKALEESESRLERTHDKLSDNLRGIMDRKIRFAESRLEKKQAIAQKTRQEAEQWQEKGENYKASALQLLEDRKVAKEGLEESQMALERAQQEEEKAEKNLKATTRRADEEVEAYRYVEGKAKAAATKASESDDDAHQAEESVQKMRGILRMEQERIDQAMQLGKQKLQGKIRALETGSVQEGQHLEKLKEEYTQWQNLQRGRVETVAQAHATTKQLSDAFQDEQDQILDQATSKVAKRAMDNSDWAWGSPDDQESAPEDSVRFSD